MDATRIDEISEMAEASEDVALQLESEIALSGARDGERLLAEMDEAADRTLERVAFWDDGTDDKVDLAVLAEDAGF